MCNLKACFIGIFVITFIASEMSFAQLNPRRSYPGGKDDSDLTVQTPRKITRKGEETEVEYHGYGESGESDSTSTKTNQAQPESNSQSE